ncbi:MAG: hypothetical protein KAS16_04570, partial [Thermoplasmata archaeon]|nr:hypothetical protein [Thermoplasmata archaeon]
MAIGRKLTIVFIISIFLLSILSFVSFDTEAQEISSDRVIVRTDYEMLGFSDLQGGGHLSYELHGKAAGDLRRAVLARYDGLGTVDGQIDVAELKRGTIETPGSSYIADLELALRNNGRFFHGVTNSYDPLHENQGEDITVDAIGFVEVSAAQIPTDDYTTIFIHFYFDSSQTSGEYTSDIIATALFDALYEPFLPRNSTAYHEITLADYKFEFHHSDYRVGLGAFYKPDISQGSLNLVRTPAGELTFYTVKNLDYNGNAVSQDRLTYGSFKFLENPQILFVIVFICGYLTSSVPTKFYADYKYSFPRRMRHKALKIKWLHIMSKLLILLMLLFYFFPTLFGVMGSNLFLSGLLLWIMAPVMTIVTIILAKLLYDKLTTEIPQQPSPMPRKREEPRPQPRTTTPAGVRVQQQPVA